MNSNRIAFVILLICIVPSRMKAVESIDNNGKSVFFLDKSKINKYDLVELKFQNKLDLLNDTALMNSFYRMYKCSYKLKSEVVKRRLSIAKYDNINCYDDRIYVTARFLSLDTTRDGGMEYLLIEYSSNLKFKRLYLMRNSRINDGMALIYPRFRLLFNQQNEVMFATRHRIPSNSKDSMGCFAVYKMNAKNGDLRFNRLLNVPKPIKELFSYEFSLYPFGYIVYPMFIPINFTNSPAYFCFPYSIVRNYNGVKVMDPFHHTSYNLDSIKYHLNPDLKLSSLGNLMNLTPVRELVLSYYTNKDTLQLLVGNYHTQKNKLAIVSIIGKHIEMKALTSEVNLGTTYFQIINNKVLAIRLESDAYVLNYIN